jgi:hypothetical protein
MSFDLFVFVAQLPTELAHRWEQLLPEFGLRCTFYPGYHPSTWHDVFAPVRVEVLTEAFPCAAAYGSQPLLTEIALDDMDVSAGEYADIKLSALKEVPPSLRPALERATRCIHLHSSAGRTLIRFRLQCFAAATLSVMTQGVLLDPQRGGYLNGQDAIRHARQLADAYEQRADPEDWNLTVFTDWSAWDGELPPYGLF